MLRDKWSREDLIIAFYLYCKIPFGRIHTRNPEVIQLSEIIGRTPAAVAWKLANFASLDPSLKSRKIKGASHVSNLDVEVWNEFNNDWSGLVVEAEELLRVRIRQGIDVQAEDISLPKGENRIATTQVRIGQSFFRSAVLAAYGGRCCITGLPITSLLVASHIVPWSIHAANRTNPRNGLCLNALHDRAFDCGLFTVTPEYRVIVSPLAKSKEDDSARAFFGAYDGSFIRLPGRFLPDRESLEYHNQYVFQKG